MGCHCIFADIKPTDFSCAQWDTKGKAMNYGVLNSGQPEMLEFV